ncbi:MAG: hypothetical protein K8J31_10915 [Anaerolineae bacterium]|nr:hypothetical protein [Anaerolineae bacterium]
MQEIELWQAAKLLIDQHGASAEDYAEARMLERTDRDDPMGAAVWMAIQHRIYELRNIKRESTIY